MLMTSENGRSPIRRTSSRTRGCPENSLAQVRLKALNSCRTPTRCQARAAPVEPYCDGSQGKDQSFFQLTAMLDSSSRFLDMWSKCCSIRALISAKLSSIT